MASIDCICDGDLSDGVTGLFEAPAPLSNAAYSCIQPLESIVRCTGAGPAEARDDHTTASDYKAADPPTSFRSTAATLLRGVQALSRPAAHAAASNASTDVTQDDPVDATQEDSTDVTQEEDATQEDSTDVTEEAQPEVTPEEQEAATQEEQADATQEEQADTTQEEQAEVPQEDPTGDANSEFIATTTTTTTTTITSSHLIRETTLTGEAASAELLDRLTGGGSAEAARAQPIQSDLLDAAAATHAQPLDTNLLDATAAQVLGVVAEGALGHEARHVQFERSTSVSGSQDVMLQLVMYHHQLCRHDVALLLLCFALGLGVAYAATLAAHRASKRRQRDQQLSALLPPPLHVLLVDGHRPSFIASYK